jgi:hypothetical protein
MAGALLLAGGVTSAGAQPAASVVLEAPVGPLLDTATPLFTVRVRGAAGPYRINLQIADNPEFLGPPLVDSLVDTPDSTVQLRLTRILPSAVTVFWRARVTTGSQQLLVSAPSGPRFLPTWLSLVSPGAGAGDILETPTPTFVWRSAGVAPPVGPWRYQLTVLEANGAPRLTTDAGLRDTSYTVPASQALLANASYRWRVRATLPSGESVTQTTPATFIITEPALPQATISYQPFPNPFPTPTTQATCFWFDVGPAGAEVTIDVLDLRGTRVRQVVPGADGQRRFAQGRYGRAAPGAGTNCSGAFVWDGTDAQGETVPPGVYLVRVRTDGVTTVRRVLFRGR